MNISAHKIGDCTYNLVIKNGDNFMLNYTWVLFDLEKNEFITNLLNPINSQCVILDSNRVFKLIYANGISRLIINSDNTGVELLGETMDKCISELLRVLGPLTDSYHSLDECYITAKLDCEFIKVSYRDFIKKNSKFNIDLYEDCATNSITPDYLIYMMYIGFQNRNPFTYKTMYYDGKTLTMVDKFKRHFSITNPDKISDFFKRVLPEETDIKLL